MKTFLRILLFVSLLLNVFFIGRIAYNRYSYKFLNHNRSFNKDYSNDTSLVKYALDKQSSYEMNTITENSIVFIGDSHIHLFDVHDFFKNCDIYNRGIPGDITLGVLKRINGISSKKPKLIILEIGVNDLLQGVSVNQVLINYKSIIQMVKNHSANTRIIVTSIPPSEQAIYNTNTSVKASILALNLELKNLCTKENLIYTDLHSKIEDNGSLARLYDSGDRLHLNGKGYLVWAQLIENYIN